MKDTSIYVKCYFRIEAGYVWGKGMEKENLQIFNDELKKIFIPLGFTLNEPEKWSNACIEVSRGAENLYCHPMDLVGEVKKDNIKAIEKVLKGAKTFKFCKTDIYEELLNYTPEELKEELEKTKIETEIAILELFKTKRSNLYKSLSPLWVYKTNIKFFRDNLDLKHIEREFINSIFESLRLSGKIKESENLKVGKIYRTVTKINK